MKKLNVYSVYGKPAVRFHLHDLPALDFWQNHSHVVVVLAPAVKLPSCFLGGCSHGFQRRRFCSASGRNLRFRLCPILWR